MWLNWQKLVCSKLFLQKITQNKNLEFKKFKTKTTSIPFPQNSHSAISNIIYRFNFPNKNQSPAKTKEQLCNSSEKKPLPELVNAKGHLT
jgi:hypothetical protein